MFRLWSTPVHRWLSSCVYRPTADYGGRKDKKKRKPTPRWRVLGMTAAFAFSSAVHEAVTYVALRRTCWPFNTFCLLFSAVVIAAWDAVYPVRSVISEASGDDEREPGQSVPLKPAVPSSSSSLKSATENDGGSVGENCCPPATGALPVSGALASDGNDEDSFVVVGEIGGGNGGTGSAKKKPGSEWRGWGAVAFFVGASVVMASVVDFLAWQWWRHTLLR